MKNELDVRKEVDVGIDSMIESKGGLFDALEQQDKHLLLDFSGSMDYIYDGKQLYKHLVDAVLKYEGQYVMIVFNSRAKITECLKRERPEGTTNLAGALKISNEKGAYEHIVVSDGLPDSPDMVLEYAVKNEMKVSTIFLGDDSGGRTFMDRLASATGGRSDNIKLLSNIGGLLEKKIKGLIEG